LRKGKQGSFSAGLKWFLRIWVTLE
jgi:hypothetical protein